MILTKITNVATKETIDLVYEVKTLSDVTSYTHSSNFNKLNVSNASFMKEDDVFVPQTIKYEARPRSGASVSEFKKFFRRKNASFILQIEKDGNNYLVYAKRNSDTIQLYRSTELEKFQFSIITETYFLKTKSVQFEFDNFEDNTPGYGDSDFIDEVGYEYPHEYGTSFGTIDRFQLSFSGIECDRQIYVKIEMLDFNPEPSVGLNGKWDEDGVEYAYKCTDDITFSTGDVLSLVSFPLFTHIRSVQNYNSDDYTYIDIEQYREFEINPYIEINPYEDFLIVFSQIKKANITIYEQYINI